MTQERPPCDVCGKPATSAACDIIRGFDPTLTWVASKPGAKHYGCDEHPASDRAIDVQSGMIIR
jgi:hypothetical protein